MISVQNLFSKVQYRIPHHFTHLYDAATLGCPPVAKKPKNELTIPTLPYLNLYRIEKMMDLSILFF